MHFHRFKCWQVTLAHLPEGVIAFVMTSVVLPFAKLLRQLMNDIVSQLLYLLSLDCAWVVPRPIPFLSLGLGTLGLYLW